ncbi:MAG: MATE family efflux transporter [Bacteroidales bacterium]|nr:MATE family efflux transporter [Bacteroidales bacterium]
MKLRGRTDALLEKVRNGGEMTLREQVLLTLLLSLPAMLTQLSNIIMEYIDASMVGSLGADASASIGLVSTSTWLIWGICGAAVSGFSVQVAHLVGAKDDKGARSVLRQSMTSVMVLSAIVSLTSVAISGPLPEWLGGTPDITEDATRYFRLLSSALPLFQFSMLCSAMLRSSGNVIVPSACGVVLCFLDVVFNFLLIFPTREVEVMGHSMTIFGAGMGVTGAALGSILAEVLACVFLFWYLVRRSQHLALRGESGSFVPTRDCLRKAASISLPMGLQHTVMMTAQVVSTIIVAPLGKLSIAANSFGITAESICYMPGYGIADAAQTLVGQSIGAKRQPLTKNFAKVSVILGMAVMTLTGIIMYAFAPLMMGLLTPVEEIRVLGIEALRIEAFAEPMFAASIVCYGVFVGAGDTLKPGVMNIVSMWAVRLTLAAWLAPKYGLAGVWTAMCIELCFRGIIFLVRMRYGKWMNKSLAE